MANIRDIRLADLARHLRVPHRTAVRWHEERLIGGENSGPGRGHGIRLSRTEALEFVALAALRAYGVTLAQVERLARELRRQGKHGAGFFDAGGVGRRALLDGAGPTAPLRELSGQAFLFPLDLLDLRPLRAQAEQLVDTLAEQGTAHVASA